MVHRATRLQAAVPGRVRSARPGSRPRLHRARPLSAPKTRQRFRPQTEEPCRCELSRLRSREPHAPSIRPIASGRREHHEDHDRQAATMRRRFTPITALEARKMLTSTPSDGAAGAESSTSVSDDASADYRPVRRDVPSRSTCWHASCNPPKAFEKFGDHPVAVRHERERLRRLRLRASRRAPKIAWRHAGCQPRFQHGGHLRWRQDHTLTPRTIAWRLSHSAGQPRLMNGGESPMIPPLNARSTPSTGSSLAPTPRCAAPRVQLRF
jgi:hypothetical protein